jgi:hypothetical protein
MEAEKSTALGAVTKLRQAKTQQTEKLVRDVVSVWISDVMSTCA